MLLVDLRFLRPSLALADMLKMKLTMIFKLFVMKWISTKSTRKKISMKGRTSATPRRSVALGKTLARTNHTEVISIT